MRAAQRRVVRGFQGSLRAGRPSRCYPLTLTDAFSRFLLMCEALVQPRHAPVRRQFELAFIEFGIPWWIRSDNGPPCASLAVGGLSQLSARWIQLGIRPERIEPGGVRRCPSPPVPSFMREEHGRSGAEFAVS